VRAGDLGGSALIPCEGSCIDRIQETNLPGLTVNAAWNLRAGFRDLNFRTDEFSRVERSGVDRFHDHDLGAFVVRSVSSGVTLGGQR
jgi:hypothetical protein